MDDAAVVSKVLVLEDNKPSRDGIRKFCEGHNLVTLRAQAEHVMSVLKSNVDLGGIFLAEAFDGKAQGGLVLARRIHAIRPELPIFLRREALANFEGISESDQKAFTAAYVVENIESLTAEVDRTIFSLSYPNALLRGITEITKAALESQFKELDTHVEKPFVVKDRLIYGEIYTLIPVEGSWCRGYMMLQADELDLMKLVKADKTHVDPLGAGDFRNLNGLLGEITNLIWGAFKNRYFTSSDKPMYSGQVPIVINHLHRYISFGSDNPQLCFKYTLTDKSDPEKSLQIHQRFVFNLNWSPEDFAENIVSVDDLVESGELEMF
jgi:CheY-like chemotaxis protein